MIPNEKTENEVRAIENLEQRDNSSAAAVLIQQMSEEEYARVEKRLKRKLDLRLTAVIVFIYILNYLDRVSIKHQFDRSNARG